MSDEQVAFTTPEVGRIFLACYHCDRTVPHYRYYGSMHDKGIGHCRCGSALVRPKVLPEWEAAIRVLACYAWRKLWKQQPLWDPRMPVRMSDPVVNDDARAQL